MMHSGGTNTDGTMSKSQASGARSLAIGLKTAWWWFIACSVALIAAFVACGGLSIVIGGFSSN